MNVLFYSSNCNTCKNLLLLLKNEELIHTFKLVCVDDKLDKIPVQIDRVPTMIITNISKPLVAQETFKWIEQIKFIKQEQNNNNIIKYNNNNINDNNINNNNNIAKWCRTCRCSAAR